MVQTSKWGCCWWGEEVERVKNNYFWLKIRWILIDKSERAVVHRERDSREWLSRDHFSTADKLVNAWSLLSDLPVFLIIFSISNEKSTILYTNRLLEKVNGVKNAQNIKSQWNNYMNNTLETETVFMQKRTLNTNICWVLIDDHLLSSLKMQTLTKDKSSNGSAAS